MVKNRGVLFHRFEAEAFQKEVLTGSPDFAFFIASKNSNRRSLVRAHKDSMDFRQGMPKTLEHKIKYINNSLVTLTMDSGPIKTIETESDGEIVSATLEKYTCFSEDGLLKVQIKNTGDLKADYIVTVTKGTMNVLSEMPAQAKTLEPLEEAELKFNVWTYRGNLETSNDYLIRLTSPTGKLYQEQLLRFDTDKYTTKYSWDLQQKNMASEGASGVSVLGDSTCDDKVDFRDFAVLARCWLVGIE